MPRTLTIARRELSSLFYSPIAYLVLALFAPCTMLIFLATFGPNQPATLRPTFFYLSWLMILFVPAISMRAISEEFRHGTIETLMTSPLSDAQVVVGKWVGALVFFAALLLPLVLALAVLEWNARPDYGPVFTGFLGLLLVGGLYLAIGLFASALTQHQLIAFVVTVAFILALTWGVDLLPQLPTVGRHLVPVSEHANVIRQFEAFSKGLIDLGNLIYFVSGIALFLFLTTKLVESRRWR